MFYASGEVHGDNLPVPCSVIHFLRVGAHDQKAALVTTRQPILRSDQQTFVVVAKGDYLISDVAKGDAVPVFFMPADERIGSDKFDLSQGLQPVLDWGFLAESIDVARRWQA